MSVPTFRAIERLGQRGLLSVWAIVLVAVVGVAAASHLLTLPAPAPSDPRLVQAMKATDGDPRWTAMHVLRAGCRCSQQIGTHLLSRRALPEHRELVVLVDEEPAAARPFENAGFHTRVVSSQELFETTGIEASPVLIVASADGAVHYVGGYTARKQGPAPLDVQILRMVRAGGAVHPLPLFGCATSQRLKRATDPLGVR